MFLILIEVRRGLF